MMWVLAILIVLVIGGIAVVAAGGGDSMAIEYDDRRDVTIPVDRPLRADDLAQIRFTTVVRGYRASEVDALLDRLAAQLEQQPAPEPWSAPESWPAPAPAPQAWQAPEMPALPPQVDQGLSD